MARVQVRLDHAGVRQVLASSGVRSMVADAAEQVGAAVRAQGRQAHSPGRDMGVDLAGDTEVRTAINHDGRPVGLVTVRHPAGIAMQAKYGVLTRAVRSLGGADWNPRNQ
jgi:hypothetical protein